MGFFFFKQKTAYEMRISDWSSDVCSSDLWEDRATCVLFGDGAGAVVLSAEEVQDDRGILATRLHAEGRYSDMLYVDGGPSATGTVGHVRLQGREVFRHAVPHLASVLGEVVAAVGLATGLIDWVVPHQAKQRMIAADAKKLALPAELGRPSCQERRGTSG